MRFKSAMFLFWFFLAVVAFSAPAEAAKYKVAPVSGGATISGRVKLSGPQPAPEKILITKNKEVCGKGYRALQWVPVGANSGLQEMVVYLKKVKQGKDWAGTPPTSAATINQKGCVFSPWLQVVRKGADLTIKNDDPVLHNIHIRELIGVKVGRPRGVKRTMLNEAQPGSAEEKAPDLKTKVKPRRTNLVAINCEAHNFMFAWMFAADHPYVAKTGKDGSFSIDAIPPGKYTLVAWHPSLGLQEKKITLKKGAKASHDFTYKAPKSG